MWRANVEVSRLSKWKRGAFINKHQVHWGREACASVWFGGMIEQQWEQDPHHQQSPAFEGVPTMLGTENPCGDSCPSAMTGPQAGQSQRDYSRTWDVRGEVFLVRDARGRLVWHKDKYFWAFMGSENPQPGLLQRKNRIFCRLCLPSICSSSRKSQHRVGGVWRLPKVDLPTHLLVHSKKSPLSCFCLCHLLSLVPRSNILSSALETHSHPLKCQTLRSPSPSPPATYCFRRAPLGT